ncbi:hypothetical protein DYH10_01225 [Candidatus Saccharibacteria bacterium CPR2]|nr:hypothetical protein [Candidatus Saccharibacteria bacterium CPR2]
MIWTNIKLALNSLRQSKLRSFLTMIAVIIGVAAFMIVTTTVEGLKSAASNEINELGGNLITVNSGKILYKDESGRQQFNFAASMGASTLTEKDLNDLRSLDGVKAAAPQVMISGEVEVKDKAFPSAFILATNEDYPSAFSQKVEKGEFFSDNLTNKNVVVVGSGVVAKGFSGASPLGSKILIRNQEFTVLGVMEEYKSSFNIGADLNNAIIIPVESAKELTGGTPVSIQEIDIQLDEGADANVQAEKINNKLLENHGGEDDFTVLKQDELIDLTGSLLDQIKKVSQAVSYIMLFVGSVVILLIMLITVKERTREIGIRKSIGATNSNILTQFLTEAVVLSWVGSLMGIALGFALGFAVKAAIDITPTYSINSIITVVIISTTIGAVGGFFPALQAARKDPVEALRYE